MQTVYKLNAELPPLGWVASCENGNAEIIHGNRVECKERFFVEGTWNGKFEDGDFLTADWFCGTGARIDEETIKFSTPTHVIGGLYTVKSGGGYCVANSLYLLMAVKGYKLDPQYLEYETDFNSVLFGIYDYKENIHVIDSKNQVTEIQVHYFRNITIDKENQISVQIKSKVCDFSCFDDYYLRLVRDIDALVKNGADKDRVHRYGTVTTISKGYDAPCCTAIARLAGCNKAVTFKPEGKYANDAGTEIAKILGYSNISERDALSFKTRYDCVESMYVATGELGANISFSAFDEDFTGNIIFAGERGDSVWDCNATHRNDKFAFNDVLSHLGGVERKLWLGYVLVPIPLYGASAWPSIYDIANSSEMKPWRLNNDYDRPIPRRIVEQFGVPRECFGDKKRGAGFIYRYDTMKRIKSKMSVTALESFKTFVKRNKKIHPVKVLKFLWKTRHIYLRRMGFKTKCYSALEYSQIPNPMSVRYMIPWAGDIILKRYISILEKGSR